MILLQKGEIMYECNVIEAEDFEFNHYIHHLDEYEGDGFDYKNELDFVYNLNEIDFSQKC